MLNKIIDVMIEQKDSFRLYLKRRKIQVASIEETIEKVVKDGCSISRFGDGEFYIIEGIGIRFQEYNEELSNRLKQILLSNETSHLVCITNAINPRNYGDYTDRHVDWMRNNFKFTIGMRLKYLDTNRKYYNLLISRFWIPLKDKTRSKRISQKVRMIWNERKIVIIEGSMTRMGVGNDLFDNVVDCKRIICPATNAYGRYQEIIEAAKSFSKDYLFLISLGPTATVLAYDLYKEGFQAIDIGHIDLEYEWMKSGSTEKINIDNKYVNEVAGGDKVCSCNDDKYLSEIAISLL